MLTQLGRDYVAFYEARTICEVRDWAIKAAKGLDDAATSEPDLTKRFMLRTDAEDMRRLAKSLQVVIPHAYVRRVA